MLSLQTVPSRPADSTQPGCVNAHGFSLHAAVRCGADQRKELERLCRYITRPAIANERLKRNRAGQVVLQLKSPYRDGTTHIVMSPLEFMQRLAALVPRPRLHLIRFHGVLAPHAKLRAAIVPSAAQNATEHAADHAHAHGSPARMSWARLLKRVFDIDIEHCPNCGGALKIIAAIEDPAVIAKILTHLELTRPRPAPLTGAATRSVPSGLIPRPDSTGSLPSRRSRSACARASGDTLSTRPPQADVWPRQIHPKLQFLTQDCCD